MGERDVRNVEASGSIPLTSTTIPKPGLAPGFFMPAKGQQSRGFAGGGLHPATHSSGVSNVHSRSTGQPAMTVDCSFQLSGNGFSTKNNNDSSTGCRHRASCWHQRSRCTLAAASRHVPGSDRRCCSASSSVVSSSTQILPETRYPFHADETIDGHHHACHDHHAAGDDCDDGDARPLLS